MVVCMTLGSQNFVRIVAVLVPGCQSQLHLPNLDRACRVKSDLANMARGSMKILETKFQQR